jgi:TolA-binding protein
MRFRLALLVALPIALQSLRADVLDDAIEAHRSGVPEVSITKLRQFLATNPAEPRTITAKLLLARCLLETQKPAEAAQILDSVQGSEAAFLKAQDAFRSGRFTEARSYFADLIRSGSNYAVEARLGLAATEKATGRPDAALETLGPLISDDRAAEPRAELMAVEILLSEAQISRAEQLIAKVKPDSARTEVEKICLQGELALKLGRLSEASDAFRKVLEKPEDRTYRVIGIARLGIANILAQKQEFEEAESELERLISDQPRSVILGDMFANLFEIYSQEDNPETSELVKWAAEDPQTSGPDRPAYALFYLMRLQIKQGLATEAAQSFQKLLDRFPDHPITVDASLILGRQQITTGHPDETIKQLQMLIDRSPHLPTQERSRIDYLLGEANYMRGDVVAARDIFQKLAGLSGYDRQDTLFNWAVCSLPLGDTASFEQALQKLEELNPDQNLIADLLFDKGVLEAKSGNASADDALRKFLQQFPNHAESAQARLIQAELRMTGKSPDPSGAARALREVANTEDPELSEKADRVKFFVAASDPSQNARTVQALAQDYLQKYPDSPAKAEVRLKLGELYFRENDFPNAQTQFELVREDSPDSPLVETALFLAGEAARKSLTSASVDRAISLFEDVYKLGGPLKFQARLEEATTMRQTRRDREATVLLDDLLSQSPPNDIRFEALDQKGEALFTLAAGDPQLYEQAITTFDTLLQTEGLTTAWKQQALYQKGKCFEKLGKQDDALAQYYDVLAVEGTGGDQLWYFRAGFDAAQILEDRRSWSSAVAIYEKLANTGGARSSEAKNRLTKLRLEHFLWPG